MKSFPLVLLQQAKECLSYSIVGWLQNSVEWDMICDQSSHHQKLHLVQRDVDCQEATSLLTPMFPSIWESPNAASAQQPLQPFMTSMPSVQDSLLTLIRSHNKTIYLNPLLHRQTSPKLLISQNTGFPSITTTLYRPLPTGAVSSFRMWTRIAIRNPTEWFSYPFPLPDPAVNESSFFDNVLVGRPI